MFLILRHRIRGDLPLSLMGFLLLMLRRLLLLFWRLNMRLSFLQITFGSRLLVLFGLTFILRRTVVSPLFLILLFCATGSFCVAFGILFLIRFWLCMLFLFFCYLFRFFTQRLTRNFWWSNSLNHFHLLFLLFFFARLCLWLFSGYHFHIGGRLISLLNFLHFHIFWFFGGLLIFELMIFHILVLLFLSHFCHLTGLFLLFFFVRIRRKVHLAVDCSG